MRNLRLHSLASCVRRPVVSKVRSADFLRSATSSQVIREYFSVIVTLNRSQWPRGLRRRSTAARLLISWVRIPPEAWMSVCCECCVLSGKGLCDELITRPEESYRLFCVVVCDLKISSTRRPGPIGGCCTKRGG